MTTRMERLLCTAVKCFPPLRRCLEAPFRAGATLCALTSAGGVSSEGVQQAGG